MFDLVSQSAQAVAQRSLYAPPLIFLTGVLTSVGPCTAPRLIAAAGMAAASPAQQRLHCAAFVAGLMSGYAALGVVGSALVLASAYSREIDVLLALSLAIAAICTLLRHHAKHECCGSHDVKRSTGGTFLLGASFALVVSPCCTPVVAAVLAYSGTTGSAIFAAICLAAFALGHAAPVVAVAATGARVTSFVGRLQLGEAVQTMSGGLTLALAAYYWVVA